MKALSLFSGVGGMDLGFQNAGIETVAFCELQPIARSILARHWPQTTIRSDVEALRGTDFSNIDIVTGGSPCQDLSVAGRREGLDGERSGLLWHQCRIADEAAATWTVWENVPGSLTSNSGRDFAAVLWGFTGAHVVVPNGGWGNAGLVVGPKRWAVWRVLDAQHFGVPQRRRRVFVVACSRKPCRPEVLFYSEGSEGDFGSGDVTWRGSPVAVRGSVTKSRASKSGATHPPSSRTSWSPIDLDDPAAYGDLALGFNWANGGGSSNPGMGYTIEGTGPIVSSQVPAVFKNGVARKLTPRECERSFGWPDDWTAFDLDGRPIPQQVRYALCGNGVVAPVAEWIGRQIMKFDGIK
jgi:DNA (cytosine-5)-methyltransferase 1